MTPKEKIQLTEAQETLLITLYSKTLGAPEGFFEDPAAWKMLERIDYDFSALRVKTGTRLTVCLRAMKLDDYVRDFLAENPGGTVIHLGCGLDTRCQRVGAQAGAWYDLDLPDVIELRRKFTPESESYHLLPASAADLDWINMVILRGSRVMIVAEGLLMYLRPEEVKSLVRRLTETFPGAALAFDAFSELTARSVHRNPSLQKTGAAIRWGIDDPGEIETWAPGVALQEEWYFSQSSRIEALPFLYRLMFRISGLFQAANKAHRVLYYRLGGEE